MKALLVIDVEEKDIGRKVNYVSVQGGGCSYIVGNMGEDVRLRPLPQKADKGMEVDISGGDDYETGYIHGWHRGVDKGWNDCIDEITGETE